MGAARARNLIFDGGADLFPAEKTLAELRVNTGEEVCRVFYFGGIVFSVNYPLD